MIDDIVAKLRGGMFLREEAADEIERNREAIAELTEALKRDVIDETRNAELNSAKDVAIAELVGMLKIARDTTYSDTIHEDCVALIAKYENTTTKEK